MQMQYCKSVKFNFMMQEGRCFGETIFRFFCCSLHKNIKPHLPVWWHILRPQRKASVRHNVEYLCMKFLSVFASYSTAWDTPFSECLWILFVFLLDFFVIAILRTVRGYEILKFTFKSELVPKSETLNKSLWSSAVGEVSSEVNSYSTHLPIVAVWATQGHNCLRTPCMQTRAHTHTHIYIQLRWKHLSPAIVVV